MTEGIQARHDFAMALAVDADRLAGGMQRGLGLPEAKSRIG